MREIPTTTPTFTAGIWATQRRQNYMNMEQSCKTFSKYEVWLCPRIYSVKLRLSLDICGSLFCPPIKAEICFEILSKRYCRTTNYRDLIRPPSINLSFASHSGLLSPALDLNCSRSLAEDVSRTESNTIFRSPPTAPLRMGCSPILATITVM